MGLGSNEVVAGLPRTGTRSQASWIPLGRLRRPVASAKNNPAPDARATSPSLRTGSPRLQSSISRRTPSLRIRRSGPMPTYSAKTKTIRYISRPEVNPTASDPPMSHIARRSRCSSHRRSPIHRTSPAAATRIWPSRRREACMRVGDIARSPAAQSA